VEAYLVEAIDPAFPTMGGSETYSRNLLNYLLSAGVGVTLLGVCYAKIPIANKDLTFIPLLRKNHLTGYHYFLRLMTKVPTMSIPTSTVIHVQRPEYMLPFIIFHPRNPKILTLHGPIVKGVEQKSSRMVSQIYKWVETFVLNKSNLIIAVDKSTRDVYLRQHPRIASKVKVVTVGINLNKFKPLEKTALRRKYDFKPTDKIVVYVGRIEKEKNLDFLVDSFIPVSKQIPEAKLVLVGDGRTRKHLEDKVVNLGRESILFMGFLEPDRIPEILNCADVLALCSEFEGSPTVVREAIACGTPVVSLDVGDVCSVIREESDGKITKRDKHDFAQALVDIISNENIEKKGKRLVKASREFSFENMGAQIVELYKELSGVKAQ
jgi:L-malate glycosyltransferase